MNNTPKIMRVPLEEITGHTASKNPIEFVTAIYNPLQRSKQLESRNLLSFSKERSDNETTFRANSCLMYIHAEKALL